MEGQKKYRTASFVSIKREKIPMNTFKWQDYIRDLKKHCDELKSMLDDTTASYIYLEERYIEVENRFEDLDLMRKAAGKNLTGISYRQD